MTMAAAGVAIWMLVWSAGCGPAHAGRSPEKTGEQAQPKAVAEEPIAGSGKPIEIKLPVGVPSEGAERQGASTDSVVMALNFVPGQTTVYKLTMQTERRVDYMGNVPAMPDELKSGRTGSRVGMVFDQQVESVGADGNAVLKITIQSLMYVGQSRDEVVLDFDSSRAADAQSPLAKLIGQSYKLQISPSGKVLAVSDARSARAAVAGNLPGNQTAQKLLSDEAIKERHGVTALVAAQKKTVRTGDSWADVKVTSFGLMGTDTLQQTYKLASIEQAAGRRVAVVEMEAIPSAVMAQQLHQQLNAPVNPGVLDNSQKDVGRLRLDLTNQRIDECTEDLTKEWVTVLPEKKPNSGYVAMKMTATQQYRLERVEE